MNQFLLLLVFAMGIFRPSVQLLDQATLKGYLEGEKAPFDFILIDVRGAGEITAAIGGADCKPYNLAWPDQFKEAIAKIPKDMAVIVYCRSGGRSAQAAAYLDAAGYTNVYDAGGFMNWKGPTVPASDLKSLSLLPGPSCMKGSGSTPK